MSNELSTPKLCVCPSDFQGRQIASAFATSATTPWLADNNANGNTNVSYFIGRDAKDTYPQSLLAGDRNMGGPPAVWGNNSIAGATPGYVNSTQAPTGTGSTSTNQPAAAWQDNGHQKQGNVLLGDASVQGWSIAGLRVAHDHARPQAFTAASLPTARAEGRMVIAPARVFRKPQRR